MLSQQPREVAHSRAPNSELRWNKYSAAGLWEQRTVLVGAFEKSRPTALVSIWRPDVKQLLLMLSLSLALLACDGQNNQQETIQDDPPSGKGQVPEGFDQDPTPQTGTGAPPGGEAS